MNYPSIWLYLRNFSTSLLSLPSDGSSSCELASEMGAAGKDDDGAGPDEIGWDDEEGDGAGGYVSGSRDATAALLASLASFFVLPVQPRFMVDKSSSDIGVMVASSKLYSVHSAFALYPKAMHN
nr:hypothetical protein Iba_chr01cCG3270 [Ipomoea batatas]